MVVQCMAKSTMWHIFPVQCTCIFMSRRINIKPIHIFFPKTRTWTVYKQTDRLRTKSKRKEFYCLHGKILSQWLVETKTQFKRKYTHCWQIARRRRRKRRSGLRFECVRVCLGYAILAFWSRLAHTHTYIRFLIIFAWLLFLFSGTFDFDVYFLWLNFVNTNGFYVHLGCSVSRSFFSNSLALHAF